MSLAASLEVDIAGSIGKVGNAARPQHPTAGEPNAQAEAQLRSRWSAELAEQTRQVASQPTIGEHVDLPASDSSLAGSSADPVAGWSEYRLAGEIQPGPLQAQARGEAVDENLAANSALYSSRTNGTSGTSRTSGTTQTPVSTSGNALHVAANSATGSQKILDRVAAVATRQFANRLPVADSKHGASKPLTGAQTGLSGLPEHNRHAVAGSIPSTPVSVTSAAEAPAPSGASGVLDLRFGPVAGLRTTFSSVIGGTEDRPTAVDLPSAISGVRPAASKARLGSIMQVAENQGSSRDGAQAAGSDITGIEAINRETLPSSGSVVRGSVLPTSTRSSNATPDGSNGPGPAPSGARILVAPVTMTTGSPLRAGLAESADTGREVSATLPSAASGRVVPPGPSYATPSSIAETGSRPENSTGHGMAVAIQTTIPSEMQDAAVSVQLPSTQAPASGRDNADSSSDSSWAGRGAGSGPGKLKGSGLPAGSNLASLSSSAVSSAGGTGFAHASLFAGTPQAPLGALSAPGFTSPGGQAGAEGGADLSRNPFLALDSSDAPDATKGLNGLHGPQIGSSGAAGRSSLLGGQEGVHSLEVGYQDPTLGYVELRAHTEGAGIHASLTTQSADSGATLEAHLSSLTGWMNERRTPVESLTVSSLASGNGGESGHSGPARHDSQGDSQGNAQNGSKGEQHRSSSWSIGEASTSAASSVAASGSSRASGLIASLTDELQSGPERSRISVLA